MSFTFSFPLESQREDNTPSGIEAFVQTREDGIPSGCYRTNEAESPSNIPTAQWSDLCRNLLRKLQYATNWKRKVYNRKQQHCRHTEKHFKLYVINTYGSTVWKGVTGPEDSLLYTDYWLWIEPVVGGILLENNFYNFNIEGCTPFYCEGGSFSYGVSIKAKIV